MSIETMKFYGGRVKFGQIASSPPILNGKGLVRPWMEVYDHYNFLDASKHNFRFVRCKNSQIHQDINDKIVSYMNVIVSLERTGYY